MAPHVQVTAREAPGRHRGGCEAVSRVGGEAGKDQGQAKLPERMDGKGLTVMGSFLDHVIPVHGEELTPSAWYE